MYVLIGGVISMLLWIKFYLKPRGRHTAIFVPGIFTLIWTVGTLSAISVGLVWVQL
jgi:hypothetical protein